MSPGIGRNAVLLVVSVALLQCSLFVPVSTIDVAGGSSGEDRLPSSYLTIFHDDFETGTIDGSKWSYWTGTWSVDNVAKTPGGSRYTGTNWYLTESPFGNSDGSPLDDNGNGGDYYPDERAMIETTWIDLTNVSNPRLEYRHMYDIPSPGDGALVFVKSDTMPDWALAIPDSPYPEPSGWSGTLGAWVSMVIRLDDFQGTRIKVGFYLRSTPDGIEGDGWYIDDVVVGGKPGGMLPDLKLGNSRIYHKGYSVPAVTAGEVVQINMSIMNEGRAASGPFTITAYTDHPLSGGVMIGHKVLQKGLGVGASTYVEMDWVAVEGQYEPGILLLVDELNLVPEEDEVNNIRRISFDVGRPSMGDAVIRSVHFEKEGSVVTGVAEGDVVSIVANLANYGSSNVTTAMILRAYDGDPDEGAPQIGDEEPIVAALGEERERRVIIHWRPPTEGNHSVHVQVTPLEPSKLLDMNPDNNVSSSVLYVTDDPGMDLVVEDLTFTIEGLETSLGSEGENVHVTAILANTGTVAFEGMVDLAFYIGDPDAGGTELGRRYYIGHLDPMMSTEIEFDWRGELGTHTVHVYVDPDNVVYEADEENNQVGEVLSINRKPLPDLTISTFKLLLNGVELDPSLGTNQGANVEIKVTVKNVGNDRTRGNTIARLYIGNPLMIATPLGEFTVPKDLNPDEVNTQSVNWVAQQPTVRTDVPVIFVRVDDDNIEPEVSEFNNLDMRMIKVGQKLPDLNITSIELRDEDGLPVTSMTYGSTLKVRVAATNVGTDVCYINPQMAFYLDAVDQEHLLGSIATASFNIDETVQRTYTVAPDPTAFEGGWHEIIAVIDPWGEVEEASDANNNGHARFFVDASARPNLLITDIAVFRGDTVVDRLEKDETGLVKVSILNLGDAPVYTKTAVRLYHGELGLDGRLVTTWFVEDLPVEGCVTFEAEIKFSQEAPVVVYIDPDGELSETNENDNNVVLPITIEPEPEGADTALIGVFIALGLLILVLLAIFIGKRPAPPPPAPEETGEGDEEPEEGVPTGAELKDFLEAEDQKEAGVEERPREEEPSVEGVPDIPVEEGAAPEVAEAPVEEARPDVEEEVEEEGAAPRCPSCGEEIDPEWILCPFCDTNLK